MTKSLESITHILASVPRPLMVGLAERDPDGKLRDMVLVWANDEMLSLSATSPLVGIRMSQMFPEKSGAWLAELDAHKAAGTTYRSIRVPDRITDPSLEVYELAGRWLDDYLVFSPAGLVHTEATLADTIRSISILTKIMSVTPISFGVLSEGTWLRFPTEAFLASLGLTNEEFAHATLMSFVAEEDRERFMKWFTTPLKDKDPRFMYRANSPVKGKYWVEVWITSFAANPAPDSVGDLYVLRDIDMVVKLQGKNAELLAQTERQMEVLRNALNSSVDGFAIWEKVPDGQGHDNDFRLSFINAEGAKATGRPPRALEGMMLEDVVGANYGNSPLRKLFVSALTTKEPQRDVVQVDSPEGWFGAYENRVFAINETQVLALFRDISTESRENLRLTWMTEHDQLTGGYNRRAMERMLEHDLQTAKADGGLVGFAFMDIDFFKRINDDFGHAVGDEVLKGFVQRVEAALDGDGVLARIAGDEFALIFGRVESNTHLERLVGGVFQALKDPFVVGVNNIKVTCSAGCVAVAGDVPTGEVMRVADRAMYLAKHKGRNQFVVA